MSIDYLVTESTENFCEVDFLRRPSASDYEEWFQKGFNPLFPPIERVCNGDSIYTIMFKAFKITAEAEPVKTVSMGFDQSVEIGEIVMVYKKQIGKVVSYLDQFPHQYVEVMIYETGVAAKYSPHNVFVNRAGGWIPVKNV